MPRSTTERSYNSPLRMAQAAQTRTLILDAMTEMLAQRGAKDFSVRLLAGEAGVSERTVYRYFPDRGALLEGLSQHLADQLGTARREAELSGIDELLDVIPVIFQAFDEMADVTRASLLLNPDPADLVESQRRRSELMIELARSGLPELDDGDAVRLGQAIRTITSAFNWLRMREEFGLDGEESGRLLAWALRAAVEEARRTGQVAPPSVVYPSADDSAI